MSTRQLLIGGALGSLFLSSCGGGTPDAAVTLDPPAALAGTLQFSAPSYEARESDGKSGFVLVTRTNGSAGIVTAKVRLDGVTALAISDFDTQDVDVIFGDGDTAPRLIPLPIVADTDDEQDETLTVTLHSPEGCAQIGAQSSAEITILDDDTPPPTLEVHTIGGTVTGLRGSGLELTNVSTDNLAIASDGPFEFPRTYANGLQYIVRVYSQPTQPRQTCTVTNGEGIGNADVSDIEVTCVDASDADMLDPTFGTDGRVTLNAPDGATALALQGDGKILAVGGGTLARFDPSGNLDTGFGTDGLVSGPFYSPFVDNLAAVATQPDGRIVISGYSRDGANSPTQEDFVTARFESDGTPDMTFGSAGQVVTDFENRGDAAYENLVQPDGTLIVTGNAMITDSFGIGDSEFAAIKYTGLGEPDPDFGTSGKTTTNVAGRTDLGYAAAMQSDGKIVLAGRVANSGGDSPDIGLVRLNADGSLDTSFANNGVLRDATPDWDEAADVTILSDGRILIVGHTIVAGAGQLVLASYNADGSIDFSFDADGRVTSPLMEVAGGVAVQADGGIVVVGRQAGDFAIARFTSGGVLDTTFGVDGLVLVDFFGGADTANAVAIQPDGSIVVAGKAQNGTESAMGILRLLH